MQIRTRQEGNVFVSPTFLIPSMDFLLFHFHMLFPVSFSHCCFGLLFPILTTYLYCSLGYQVVCQVVCLTNHWSGLLFSSPVDHVLSELSTMTHPSWVAIHSLAHSFFELDMLWSMWSVWLVFCDCGFHSFWPLKYKDKKLVETSW